MRERHDIFNWLVDYVIRKEIGDILIEHGYGMDVVIKMWILL